MPRRNALSAFIRGIRGEKPRSPGSRPRSDRSWRCRRAGFDRVEKHAGDIQPELRIQLADARRAGDVDLGEVVADHVQAHEEIGRASWRERVGHYLKIRVGPGN